MNPSWRPSSKRACGAVAREEDEDAVVALHLLAVGEFVAQRLQDALARGVAVDQLADVLPLESEFRDQRLLDAVRVVDGIPQLRPVLIIVDPDDQRPALAIQAAPRRIAGAVP